eukprot:TRINITY_DN40063_c0_g1_i1.p3 TRINITY_DN40063_c0_g1~~TRINITY_DN40063_c0_g1_i1.p3  ORF type:complete len:102 (-),score=25.61 TRINITY_DN40063_c0_g1_i1:141-446(-)
MHVVNVVVQFYHFFFFKQKTAYEMQRGLVGSEMCIRDSVYSLCVTARNKKWSEEIGGEFKFWSPTSIHSPRISPLKSSLSKLKRRFIDLIDKYENLSLIHI